MDTKYTAAVLLLIIVGSEASTLQKLATPILKQAKWDGLGLTANINDYIDETVTMLIPFIHNHGLDPMPLPELEEGFQVRPVFITYSAWLTLHDGYMSGLENVKRYRDQQISYFAKMVRLRLQFEALDLDFIYRYRVKVMNIGPTGGIVGSLDRLTVVADVLIDFNNDEIHLQEFSLNDIGRLRVRFTGNPLTDWLVNPVASIFVRLFDTVIIWYVEINLRQTINGGIEFINSGIKEVFDRLESI